MDDESNPFRSPETISQPAASATAIPRRLAPRFASGSTRAGWAMALLGLVLIIDLVSTGSDYLQIQLLERAAREAPIGPAEVNDNDARQQMIGMVALVFALGSAISFLMWFHRVHRNLGSLNAAEIKYSPGWAVGSFFVPILNLFRPFQIMKEVWRGSDPQSIPDASRFAPYAPASALVGMWWTLWIVMGVLGQISTRLTIAANNPDSLFAATWVSIAANVVSVVGAFVTIAMVRAVDQNQQARHEIVAATEPKPVIDPFASDFASWEQNR